MSRYSIFSFMSKPTPLGWLALGILIAIMVGICFLACSSPFVKTVQTIVNPTFTAQIQTPQGPIAIQIPAELPDFVTGKIGAAFPGVGNICVLMYSGVTTNSEGRIIDRYEFIIKCNAPKILALRATTMDTDRFWIYIEGIPIPASHDQVKERIEGLIGKGI